jgi:diguanylate cyclase (GGDEF)-like protein
MDCKQYDEQLLKLIKNEEEINFFLDILNKDLWDNHKDKKELIDYVIEFCEKNGLDEALAWMFYHLGFHYDDFGDFKKAIEIHKIARDIFMNSGNKRGMAYACNGLLSVYCQNGQYELANQVAISAIDIANELNDSETVVKLLSNVSINYTLAGSNKEAKDLLEYILKVYGISKFSIYGKIVFYKTLAEVEINLGNFEEAYDNIQLGFELNTKNDSNVVASELRKLLGMYYARIGKDSEAEDNFSKSCEIASVNGYLSEEAETLIEWAQYKFDYGLNSQAIEYLKKALEVSQVVNVQRLVKESSILLYNYYNRNKKYEEALYYLELYLRANKKIQELNNTSYIGKLHLKKTNNEINLSKILHDKTETLFSIGHKILSTFDVKEMVTRVINDILKLIDADFFAIIVYNPELDEIVVTKLEYGVIEVSDPIKLADDQFFTAHCIRNKQSIVINDIRQEYKRYVNDIVHDGRGIDKPISIIYLPIMFKDEILGVVSVQSLRPNEYNDEDIKRLRMISNYIAVSLKNASRYQKMEEAAIYDSLTGFLTKRELLKLGNLQIDEFNKNSTPFCIIMIDIDDFKDVNDTYGHIVGDKVLKALGIKISKLIRSSDFIGRYGGDEFVLVCSNTKADTAYKVSNRICEAFEESPIIVNNGIPISISLSIGVHEYDNSNASLLSGIDAADAKMFLCKNSKNMNK